MSSDETRDIRYAADTIYRNLPQSSHPSQRSLQPERYARINFLNYITEEYIAGFTHNGQMSNVRRFFCLFVTFDLFFISLLWLIQIMMNGDTIANAFRVQVLNYSIQTSLFDIIVVALLRFFFLWTFYGLFIVNHWSIIFLTTAGSCGFLIGKVFYYNWVAAAQPVLQVVMIIVSCLLAWGEAWFLDCRVIPQEKNAQRWHRSIMSQNDEDERSPLLQPYISDAMFNAATEGSVAHFYSPIESAHNSDSEDDSQDDELYKCKGHDNIQAVIEILKCDGWKLEKTISATGDKIQTIQREFGKVYRMTGTIKLPPKKLLHILFDEIEDMPKWNPTMMESKILKTIDKQTDITYQVSAPSGGGLVGSRDFVNLRCWQQTKNGHITSSNTSRNEDVSNPAPIRKTISETQINLQIEENIMNQSITSLSKSLGAKVLADDVYSTENEMFQSMSSDSIDYDPQPYAPITSIDSEQRTASDDIFILSGVSITFDRMPSSAKYIRGNNLMASWALKELDADSTTFDWVICLDFKGNFPQYILNKAFQTAMQEFMCFLRKHCDSRRDS